MRAVRVTRREALFLALTVLTLAYLPALALLPAGLGIMHGVYEGRRGWTALCAALMVAAFVLAIVG